MIKAAERPLCDKQHAPDQRRRFGHWRVVRLSSRGGRSAKLSFGDDGMCRASFERNKPPREGSISPRGRAGCPAGGVDSPARRVPRKAGAEPRTSGAVAPDSRGVTPNSRGMAPDSGGWLRIRGAYQPPKEVQQRNRGPSRRSSEAGRPPGGLLLVRGAWQRYGDGLDDCFVPFGRGRPGEALGATLGNGSAQANVEGNGCDH